MTTKRFPLSSDLIWWLALTPAVLLVVWPFFTHTGIPITADGKLHLYRAVLWRHAWEDGMWWPRWHTLLAGGFGYPLFTFTPPLVYAILGIFQSLFSPVWAFKAFIVITVGFGYALGMYVWARQFLCPSGAYVAALAYLLAPYRFRELYVQGNIQQFWAWGLLPWILWAVGRLAGRTDSVSFLATVLFVGAFLLSHHVSVLIFTPFLLGYVLWLVSFYPSSIRVVCLAFGCAIGIGLLFWGPAVAESAHVTLRTATGGFFDPNRFFVNLDEILAFSPPQDSRAYNPIMPFNLGPGHAFLALVGTFSLLRRFPETWRDVRLLAFGYSLFALFLVTPASRIVWTHLQVLAFVQFPTRFYGVVFVFLSLLIGFSLSRLGECDIDPHQREWGEIVGTGLAALFLIWSIAPYLFWGRFEPVDVSLEAIVKHEESTATVGTTASGEFLPVSPQVATRLPRAITRDLQRQAFFAPPAHLTGQVAEWNSHSFVVVYTATTTTTVDLAQFFFPGWKAWVDGEPIAVKRNPENGLIRVTLPAGRHVLTLQMTNPPVRRLSAFLALASLAIALVATWRLLFSTTQAIRSEEKRGRNERKAGLFLFSLLLSLLVGKVAWVEPHTTWFRVNSPPNVAAPAAYQVFLPLEKAPVALIGYDVEPQRVVQGKNFRVRLYWQLTTEARDDLVPYSSFVHLVVGPQQEQVVGSDHVHPADIPVTAWNSALYVVDEYVIRVPENALPVVHRLVVGMYTRPLLNRVGTLELPTPVYVLPRSPVRVTGMRQQVSFGEQEVELIASDLKRTDANQYTLTLYWRAHRRPQRDYVVFVHLVDAQGHLLATFDSPPVGGYFPFTTWLPGLVVKDERLISVPEDVQPSALLVGLYDLHTMTRLPAYALNGARLEADAVTIPLSQHER